MKNEAMAAKAADNIRILSAAMVEKANSGHPGGAMGGADFMQILFAEYMRFDPADPSWPWRDRFFLDPGHMSPMLYATLALWGNYSLDDLKEFRQWGSPTPGHPELDLERGVENTSGPLGQGHVMGIGSALAEAFLRHRFGQWTGHKTFAYISDGGIQEEISQGAGRIAGFLGLSNFVMFYDANDIQLSTETKDCQDEDTAAKYKAWGWHVLTINGNDHNAIRKALDAAVAEDKRPTLIVGKTTMGLGALDAEGNSFEGKVSTHGQPLGKAGGDLAKTIANLGGDPENPFVIFPEVADYMAEVKKATAQRAAEARKAEADWRKANAEQAATLDGFLAGQAPELDYASIAQKEGVATRAASSAVLSHFADTVGNMVVASADLSNSDKTDGFLKKTSSFKKHDFSGAFLQAGVSEFTMAAMANGMALHGGVIPAVGTFFVFSDYMKPAFRLSALMQLPVKFIWTHDAFRVGEDGPTHQPVEQEAQLRLLEHLKNHSGQRSLLAMRPADAAETTVCWQLAMATTDRPSALVLSRQNILDLPAENGHSRYEAAQGALRGAYVVKHGAEEPDLVLVGNGSEVRTLYEGALLLEEKGLKVRVVSAPSEGLFRDQDLDYQQEVLPSGVPAFGLTAGLPITLQGLVGSRGAVFGLDHFGYSAPAGVLDQKFGFTPENVFDQAMDHYRAVTQEG